MASDITSLVTDHHGTELPAIDGLSASIVLKPGAYTAKAQIGSELAAIVNDAVGIFVALEQDRDERDVRATFETSSAKFWTRFGKTLY